MSTRPSPALAALLLCTACRGGGPPAPGTPLWARALHAPPGTNAGLEACAVDAGGDVVIAGRFRGTVDVGTGPLHSTTTGGYADGDLLLARMDAGGRTRWAHHFPFVTGVALAMDAAGNTLVAGSEQAGVELGQPAPALAAGVDALFVAKVDPAGHIVFSRRYEGGNHVRGTAIATGPGGGFVVAGVLAGTVDLGGGPLVKGCCAYDVFVAAFDGEGRHRWSFASGPDGNSALDTRLGVDASGNAVLATRFEGPVQFAGLRMAQPAEVAPQSRFDLHFGTPSAGNLFAASLDRDGRLAWSRRMGGAAEQDVDAVAVDPQGAVTLALEASGPLRLEKSVTVPVVRKPWVGDSHDLVLVRLDATGRLLWHRRFAGRTLLLAARQHVSAMAPAPDGGVVIGGRSEGWIRFGGSALHGDQAFVARLDGQGGNVFTLALPSTIGAYVTGAATDREGHTVIAGRFTGTMRIGGFSLAGSSEPRDGDGFVARLQ